MLKIKKIILFEQALNFHDRPVVKDVEPTASISEINICSLLIYKTLGQALGLCEQVTFVLHKSRARTFWTTVNVYYTCFHAYVYCTLYANFVTTFDVWNVSNKMPVHIFLACPNQGVWRATLIDCRETEMAQLGIY